MSLLDGAFNILSLETTEDRAHQEFEVLKPWLVGQPQGITQAAVARELSMTEGAVRVAIYRLRRRFRESVKAEIAQTVERPEDVADELRHLIAVLA